MNTDRAGVRCARAALGFWLLMAGVSAWAQLPASSVPPAGGLSSPIGSAPAGGLSSPVGQPPAGVGTGAGFHDPRSAFKPLQERDGVVSWKLLGAVKAKVEKNKVLPVFPPDVRALNAQPVKVQGFMMPLEPGERQRHFLLSAVPTTCSFCVPAGPEGLVEVRTKEPVRYTVEAVTVQGRFMVLNDDKYGLFYRVADAVLSVP